MRSKKKVISTINIALIAIETIVLLLSKLEVLSLEYGWEGRQNQTWLFFTICAQVLFLFIIKPGLVIRNAVN